MLWNSGPDLRFNGDMSALSRQCGVNLNKVKQDRQHGLLDGSIKPFVSTDLTTKVEDLPTSFDSAEKWTNCASMINDIRDQSDCGCCWAFAAAEAASDRMW